MSPRSLLALEPRFAQLLIDGASLDVRRDKSGRIRVAGLDFASAQGAGDDDIAADWFFRQHEFVIRAGTLRWIDEARDAEPLALADVELVVRNGLREHDVRLDATPPAGWGDRFSVRGRFTQPLFVRSSDWRRWSGKAYVELPRADVSELRRRMTLPFELSEGDGALRGWFEVKDGQPTGASVDVALRAVALRLEKGVEALEFEQVEGRIDAEKKGDRTSISVHDLGFRTGDGLTWPQSDLRVAWRQDEAATSSAASSTPIASTSASWPRSRRACRSAARCASCSPMSDRAASSASCAPAGTGRSIRPSAIASRASSPASRCARSRRPRPTRSAGPA